MLEITEVFKYHNDLCCLMHCDAEVIKVCFPRRIYEEYLLRRTFDLLRCMFCDVNGIFHNFWKHMFWRSPFWEFYFLMKICLPAKKINILE